MRVVIDTSVWVSALLSPESNARRVLEAFLDERFVLLYNRETLLELRDVSKRPKFKGKIAARQWTALERKIRTLGEPIGITHRAETSDPKDDYLLEIALSGDADALVTGRRGLAEHHAHQKTEDHQRGAIPENAWVQIEAIQLSNNCKLERVTRHGTQMASVTTAARAAGE